MITLITTKRLRELELVEILALRLADVREDKDKKISELEKEIERLKNE